MKKVFSVFVLVIFAMVLFSSCNDVPKDDKPTQLDPKGAIFYNIVTTQNGDSTTVTSTMIVHDEKGTVVGTYVTTQKIKTLPQVTETLGTGETNSDGDEIERPVSYRPKHAMFIDVK